MNGHPVTQDAIEERRWAVAGLVVDTPAGWRLVGSRCAGCDSLLFPQVTSCARCGSGETVPGPLTPGGTLHAATRVERALPGFVAPYWLAIVNLDDGPRLYAPLLPGDGEPRVGDRVTLTVTIIREEPDGTPVWGHAFAIAGADGSGS